TIRIQAPYLTKVEFHQNGWAHFHVIFRTRRFLDGNALRHLWGYGRTHVARIQQKDFRYLLKYVTKGGEIPDWVLNRKRIRIIQTARGFYKPDPEEEETKAARSADPTKAKKRECSTIRERLEKWSRMAILIHSDNTC